MPSRANWGTVSNVSEEKQKGEGTGIGAVAGGVLGGVLGHQVGNGRGNVMNIAGQKDSTNPQAVETLDRLAGFLADPVGDGNRAEK